MKYEMFFENSWGAKKSLGVYDNEDDARSAMVEHYTSFNFKSYYTRSWQPEQGHTVYDVGSHNEFYHMYEVKEDA